MTAVEQIIDLW